MFCKNCGSNFEGQDYCPYCGTFFVPEDSGNTYDSFGQDPNNNIYGQTPNSNGYGNMPRYTSPYNAQRNQVPEKLSDDGSYKKILVFGILGLALSTTIIIGPIFAILAIVNYINYLKYYGNISGQAITGFILGIVGLLVSVLLGTVIFNPSCIHR